MLFTSKIASVCHAPSFLTENHRLFSQNCEGQSSATSFMRASPYLPRLGLLLLLPLLLRLLLLARKRGMLLGERRGRRGCHGCPAPEIRLLLLLELRGLSQEGAARTDRRRGRRDGALCRRPCDRRGWLGWRTWRETALVRAEITVPTGLTGGK